MYSPGSKIGKDRSLTGTPPVFRPNAPQRTANVLQAKPAAPPVYRPQQQGIQPPSPYKPNLPQQAGNALQRKTAAPPVYRPLVKLAPVQMKMAGPPIYRPQQAGMLVLRTGQPPKFVRGGSVQPMFSLGKSIYSAVVGTPPEDPSPPPSSSYQHAPSPTTTYGTFALERFSSPPPSSPDATETTSLTTGFETDRGTRVKGEIDDKLTWEIASKYAATTLIGFVPVVGGAISSGIKAERCKRFGALAEKLAELAWNTYKDRDGGSYYALKSLSKNLMKMALIAAESGTAGTVASAFGVPFVGTAVSSVESHGLDLSIDCAAIYDLRKQGDIPARKFMEAVSVDTAGQLENFFQF